MVKVISTSSFTPLAFFTSASPTANAVRLMVVVPTARALVALYSSRVKSSVVGTDLPLMVSFPSAL